MFAQFSHGPKVRVVLEFEALEFKRASLSFSGHFECQIQGDAEHRQTDLLMSFLQSYSEKRPFPVELYPNNLKNWEFGKEGPQNFCSERETIAERLRTLENSPGDCFLGKQVNEVNRPDASENGNCEANPTPPKTNYSSCLGINLEHLSAFRKKALKQLQKVPFGEVVTYGELAAQINSPKASRAIGMACHHNPYPIFIPCHRVVASGNKLGGFACDSRIKQMLLDFETEK